jgi:hypothetical protein
VKTSTDIGPMVREPNGLQNQSTRIC